MKSWWQQQPLRHKFALWYGLTGTLLFAAFSAVVFGFVAYRLAKPLDYHLREDLAKVRERLIVKGPNDIRWDGKVISTSARWPTENPWFELWNEERHLVLRLWPFRADRVELLPAAPAPDRETISIFNVAQDLRLRALSVPLEIPGHPSRWMLRVMIVHERASDALMALRWIILVALPLVVSALVLLGIIMTRQWLAPLDHMVAEAKLISASDLKRRLPVFNPKDDLGELTIAFNETLTRLENSFTDLDRFAADVSHGLRTPLTALRSVGEVGLRTTTNPERYRDIIGSMLEEAHRLDVLVQRLLDLASAEGGSTHKNFSRIEANDFVAKCVEEIAILAETKAQRIELQLSPCTTVTDPVILSQVLHNLIDNAMKYSPAGTTIRLAVSCGKTGCVITVQDEGPGLPTELQSRFSERFSRLASSNESGGVGLGLALAKAYMNLLGGKLAYRPGQPIGSIFELILPPCQTQPLAPQSRRTE